MNVVWNNFKINDSNGWFQNTFGVYSVDDFKIRSESTQFEINDDFVVNKWQLYQKWIRWICCLQDWMKQWRILKFEIVMMMSYENDIL